ncbi:autotransporter outer membrane beta-barrel domain-containing protein [Phyllobacterium salinisoli]|uniref:Autotransporter outer membrane beta-barrel domain-containing protein n=1 Tax=Phyllobacterium salinisoli TaxID=1899321 RepID=A0A368K9S4_9HYPH|nr:autotransporter-associated beta strand repeat-containing protein [Phyllobacterium salinisoli]RCS24840.1 autotransporter outer membrane beta-barrel domain-containing protein [Phyllobacterium salinisoli]
MMRQILRAPISNVADVDLLSFKAGSRQPNKQDQIYGLRRNTLSRFFRAALATTSAIALVQALMFVASKPAAAQTTNWNGSQDSNWFNPNNWSNGAPNSSMAAYIDNSTRNPVIIATPGALAGATMVPRTGTGVSLRIEGGGTLTSSSIARIGDLAGSAGAATVTGTGSTWTVNFTGSDESFVIGAVGTGTLDITSGGSVVVIQDTMLGRATAGKGTLNISGGGTLETTALKRGGSTVANGVQANFNGGILKAHANNTNFISGFRSGELNLQSGGLTIDSNGFNVSTASPFSGTGGLTKTGAGTLTLTGASTFTGDTTVNGGTLTLNAASITPGKVFVGNAAGASGNLVVENGSTITNSSYVRIAEVAGSTGVATIRGGSTWTINNNIALIVGNSGDGTLNIDGAGTSVTTTNGGYTMVGSSASGKGTLNITGGGKLTTAGDATIAASAGSTGTVKVDGNGSSWEMAGLNISVNSSGATTPKSNGSLTISNNATVTTKTSGAVVGNYGIGSVDIKTAGKLNTAGVTTIGNFPSGEGTVTIDGTGSKWTSASNVGIGNAGKGTLTVQNNGEMVVTSGYTSVGDRAAGTLNILSGGMVTSTGDAFLGGNQANTAFGGGGSGTVLVSGAGSLWGITGALYAGYNGAAAKGDLTIDNQGEVTVGGALVVGNIANGTSTNSVTVQSGGTLTAGVGRIGGPGSTGKGGTGSVTIDGPGSQWNVAGTLWVGASGSATNPGNGTLTISNNGAVTTGDYFTVGEVANTQGVLRIESGGTLTVNSAAYGAIIGNVTGSVGTATVTGTGSQLTNNERLYVGRLGTGTLNIENAGTVTATSGTSVATEAGSSGTLNVNGGANGAGVLETTVLLRGAGTTAQVKFDGGVLRALASNTNFISGFTGSQFEIASGGMVVDTAGFDVATAAGNVVSGAGTLTKVGAGTLTLSGANTFSGGLTVNGGTAAAGAAGAFSSGLLTVADGATADLAGFDQTVSGLASPGTAGTASIRLGAGRLTVDQATGTSSSFGGVISGTGGLTKANAGTLTLSGNNSYTGTTTVSGGTLVVNGNQSAATGAATVASGATLSGAGTLGGSVSVASGGTLLSRNDATGGIALNINGNLTLASGANLDYAFGTTPNADPDGLLVDVVGNVDLGGATLNVSGSGFDPGGVYGLIEYTGTKSGNLVAGTIPAGLYVQTAMANRVNLVNTNGLGAFSFWDGAGNAGNGLIDGGDGVWQGDAFGANQNWLEATGVTNGPFKGGPAIFGGTAGTVQVDNSQGAIVVSGMQFMADGYILDGLTPGDMITLTPATGGQVEIAVGDKNSVPYTTTINAGLTGTAELVKTDAGTLVLTNAGNNYTGGTRIEDGTLSISADGNLGQAGTRITFDGGTLQNTTTAFSTTRPVTLEAGGGTFETDVDLTLSGIVDGAGALTKTGAGNLTLNGANTYGGGTTVDAGTLTAGSATAFGAASGVLTVNGGTADLNSHSMTLAGLAGTGGTVALGSAALTLNQAGTSSYSGVISGAGGSLTKSGAGNLTLSGANSYSGGTTVTAGALTAGSTSAFGSGVLTVNGGTADLNNNSMTLAGLAGTGGTVSLGSATLTLNQGTNSSYAGNVTGAGALVKNSAGELTLSGANTFAGGLTVNDGTVKAGSVSAFGAASGVLTVNGGIADLNNYSMTVAGLAGTGGEVKLGTTLSGSTLTVNQAGTSSYSGTITGTGSLVMSGAGTLTLAGANTFSGGLRVNNGDVIAGSTTAFGSGVLTVNAGTADLNNNSMTLAGLTGNGGNVTLGSAILTLDQTTTTTSHSIISGTGGIVMNGSGELTLAGANTFSGGVTVAAGTVKAGSASAFGAASGVLTVNAGTADLNGFDTTLAGLSGTGGTVMLNAATLTLAQNGTSSYAGQVTGSGGLVMDGTGTQTLSGNNDFTGGVTVTDGTLKAGSATAFGAATNMLTVNGGVADLDGNSMTLAGLQGAGGQVTLGAATLTLDQNTDTIYAGSITGAGSLVKQGTGKLTLSGTSTYGTTSVDAGTLQVNGSITSQTTVDGATSILSGSGSITGNVTVQSAGTLRSYDDDADGQNKLTINGKLTVDAGSFLQYDYGHAPDLDPDVLMVDVNGDVDLNGTVKVSDSSGAGFGPGVYGIVHYTGTRTGTLTADGSLATYNLTLQQGVVANHINLINLGTGERNWWDPTGANNDGTIKGGNGTWTRAQTGPGAASWSTSDGMLKGHYDPTFAIFTANPGTVTVDNSSGQIAVAGMQFTVDGYTIQGQAITLDNATGYNGTTAGETSIIVGDRSGTSQGHVVTIASVLQGTDRLVKEDVGTLKLSGINTYSGGTTIDDGTLQISDDRNLGAAGTDLTFAGTSVVPATLRNTAAIVTSRPVTLNGTGGTFETVANLTLNGIVGGPGALTKTGAATLTLTGANHYAGGTFINAGTLSVSSNGNLGADAGGITFNGGTLENTAAFTTSARPVIVNASGGTFKTDANLTLAGAISGPAGATGDLTKTGAGKLILTADGNYSGTMTVAQGELSFGNAGSGGAGTAGSIAGPIVNNAALTFDRSNDFTYAGLISGSGTVTQKGPGTTTLSAANSYKGATTVTAGMLLIDGDQSAATGQTTVANGGTLGGSGIIGGKVMVASGGTLYAFDDMNGINTLHIKGDLGLDPGASLNYDYGLSPATGNHDALAIKVDGALDLNGTLNVANTSGQAFDPGVYGLIRYKGALTGSGLTLGTMPSSDFFVQTSVNGQVNLAYTAGETLNFWDGGGTPDDGTVSGGSGVWQASGGNNWTTIHGTINSGYTDDSVPVFMGTPGTVTVDDSLGAISVAGMQFFVSGYHVEGDAITLTTGRTPINVGDNTSDSAGMSTTIASELTGAGQLAKTGLGTLILTGANTYTGGTLIDAGTLQVANDENLGAAGTLLELDGGTLENTAAMSLARNVALHANGGTFDTDADLTIAGRVSGAGSLTKTGAASLILSAATTYSGATFVKAGTLAAGAANAFSAASAFTVDTGAALDLRGHDQSVGALANAGTVKLGDGTPGTTLTVNGNYAGDNGTIELGTVLEGDDAKTDRLHVKGTTSGTTTLAVENVGGGGAQTNNGIRLVEVDGASSGTFTLSGDYVFQGDQALVAGAYAYRLFKNGIASPDDGDWYLRSSLLEGDNPQFQAGVPVYEAYAGILQSFNQFDTLQSRLGNRAWTIEAQGADGLSEEVAPEQSPNGQSLGVWGNIEASDHRYRPERSTSDTDYDASVWKIEAGVDGQLYETETGRLIGGASLHYGTIAADIASPHGHGKIDSTGYGIAGTLTWYGNDGLYIDGQAKLTWYDSDLYSDTANQSLVSGNDGLGYGLSIEAGKRIPIKPDWFITPQAQLAWSRVEFDGFSDGFDADVTLKDGDSVLARMGLAVDYENEWQDSTGQTRRLHAYGLANLYYDLDNGTTIDVASTPFVTKNEPLWGGIGFGGSYNWNNDKFSIYGQTLAKTSLNNFADSHALSGNVGFRIKW